MSKHFLRLFSRFLLAKHSIVRASTRILILSCGSADVKGSARVELNLRALNVKNAGPFSGRHHLREGATTEQGIQQPYSTGMDHLNSCFKTTLSEGTTYCSANRKWRHLL